MTTTEPAGADVNADTTAPAKDAHDGSHYLSRGVPASAPANPRQHQIDALVAERFSAPVREWKPKHRSLHLAAMLDLLAEQQTAELQIVRDAS